MALGRHYHVYSFDILEFNVGVVVFLPYFNAVDIKYFFMNIPAIKIHFIVESQEETSELILHKIKKYILVTSKTLPEDGNKSSTDKSFVLYELLFISI